MLPKPVLNNCCDESVIHAPVSNSVIRECNTYVIQTIKPNGTLFRFASSYKKNNISQSTEFLGDSSKIIFKYFNKNIASLFIEYRE